MLCGDHHDNSTAIIGAGCGGLTLGLKLIAQQPIRLVLIDPREESSDHIWAYWDDGGEALAEARALSHAKWMRWTLVSEHQMVILEGNKHCYRALSSASLENSFRDRLITGGAKFLKDTVLSCSEVAGQQRLKLLEGCELVVNRVFDSRSPTAPNNILLQHFVGWHVVMDCPVFDPNTAILMDFRVSQELGFHFMYILPFTDRTALIESTVFSTEVLPLAWYENQIKMYLHRNFSGKLDRILKKENAIIPMANLVPKNTFGTPIGMSAGALRASSGYAFSQIQRQISEYAHSLCVNNKALVRPGCSGFERWMDVVFLEAFNHNPKGMQEIFLKMAKAVSGDQFAQFMRGYGGIIGRLRLIFALPKIPFLRAALKARSK